MAYPAAAWMCLIDDMSQGGKYRGHYSQATKWEGMRWMCASSQHVMRHFLATPIRYKAPGVAMLSSARKEIISLPHLVTRRRAVTSQLRGVARLLRGVEYSPGIAMRWPSRKAVMKMKPSIGYLAYFIYHDDDRAQAMMMMPNDIGTAKPPYDRSGRCRQRHSNGRIPPSRARALPHIFRRADSAWRCARRRKLHDAKPRAPFLGARCHLHR